jgi:hypothetical protein
VCWNGLKTNAKRALALQNRGIEPMRRPCTFKRTDVTRAAKAVLAAGLEVERIEICKDGSIVVFPGKPDDAPADNAPSGLPSAGARSVEIDLLAKNSETSQLAGRRGVIDVEQA